MADSPGGRFDVSAPQVQMEEARRLAAVATAAGRRADFARWMKEVRYRLAHEADEWGEGREYLPALDLHVRVGVVGDLTVWYAVNIAAGEVFIREFRLRGDPGAGAVGAS